MVLWKSEEEGGWRNFAVVGKSALVEEG